MLNDEGRAERHSLGFSPARRCVRKHTFVDEIRGDRESKDRFMVCRRDAGRLPQVTSPCVPRVCVHVWQWHLHVLPPDHPLASRVFVERDWLITAMSHHLFLLSPSDTPLYNLTHYSSKPSQSTSSPLASNLPSWSTSAFAGTLTALSGASSATQTQHGQGGTVKIGAGQDRHVIQMIANASLDAIEEVMRKDSVMFVPVSPLFAMAASHRTSVALSGRVAGTSNPWTSSTSGRCRRS